MAIPVEMPKLGNTVEECLLAKWRKHKGDRVAAGEIVADIETDKATFELPSPAEGTLLEVFAAEGALVPVFTNVFVVGEPGESVEAFRPPAAAPAASAAPAPAPAAAPVAARASVAPPAPGPQRHPAAAPAVLPQEYALSPRARRFAEEHGFQPPPGFAGSGPGGRILEADLRALYHETPRASSLARKYAEAGYELRGEGSGPNGMVLAGDLTEPPQKLSGIRERIARRMRESLAQLAQYTMTASADATAMLALRKRIKASEGALPDVNINEMVMFAAVKALLLLPDLNAELVDGKLYRNSRIHLGFACDTAKGLLVPVVKDCQRRSLKDLAAQVKELTRQAVEGAIAPDDLSGATFTISNLGNLGIESFTPIINPPQVAILGVDAIQLRPVRRNGAVEFVDYIGLSLTCDHQVVDGAPGARFLKVLREQIEAIESLCGDGLDSVSP